MNEFDIVVIGLMTIGFIRGNLNGLFEELASLASLVGGVVGAVLFSHLTVNLLSRFGWEEKYVTILAYILTFAVIVTAIIFVGKLFTKFAEKLSLGYINSILGGIFGILKVAVIISSILFIFKKINTNLPFISQEDLDKSLLYIPIKKIAPTIYPTIEVEIEKHLEKPGKLI